MTHKKSTYLLYTTVFVSGAVVMILELTGSRILAPYVGNSLPVWTGLIGIILGSLSIGYVLGGKVADRNPTYTTLSKILFLSSLTLGIIPLLSKLLLPLITQAFIDIRLTTSIGTIVLFAFPSILLGMVSPFVIRLRLESVKTSGTTAGTLYAVSTIGSIFGTFFAGFFLIAFLGSHTILYFLAVTMLIITLLISSKAWLKYFIIFLLTLSLVTLADRSMLPTTRDIIADKDTQYNRVLVSDQTDPITNQTIRELLLGNVHNSAMYLESNELVYPYTKYYRLVDHFVPDVQHALVIGAGGYSYPKDFIREHPDSSLDIVEIDPGVTETAKEYFSFTPTAKTKIFHEDGRTFLNREEKQYNAILIDAFSDYSHPFQLTTKEALTHMHTMLSEDGIIITNVASSIFGPQGQVFRAEYHTYKSVFPHVAAFLVSYPDDPIIVQNIMIVASKKELNLSSTNKEFEEYLATAWTGPIPQDVQILTDDYAPVEYYAMKILK